MTTYPQHFDDALPQPRPKKRVRAALFGRMTMWLALVMLIGAWIGISDGSTRPYIPDYELLPIGQVLGYEAYKLAWVFAAVTFPFVMLHGRSLKFSFSESYLLWFVLGVAAYAKDFAYMKVPGVPIYITDITLVVMLLSTFLWPKLRIPKLSTGIARSLIFFFVLGCMETVRGVMGGSDKVDILRDFSVQVYTLFFFVGLYAKRRKELVEQVCLMVICGAIIATIVGVAWYVSEPDMRRYINYIYVPLGMLLVVTAMVNRKAKLSIAIPVMLVLGWGMIVSNTRSNYLALLVSLVAMVGLGFGRIRWKDAVKPILAVFIVLVIAIGTLTQTRDGQRFMARITEQVVQVTLHFGDDDNAQWRLLAWAEAMRRFAGDPVIGEGFGVPFIFEKTTEDVRPHNMFVTVLYKMGVIGEIAFLSLLGFIVIPAWKTIRRCHQHPDSFLLRGLFASGFFMLVFGAINPLIETPFLASMFWITLGLLVGLSKQINAETPLPALRTAAAGGN